MQKEDLELLLSGVVRADASTLHLAAGHRPSMRLKGRLVCSDEDPIAAIDLESLSKDFLFDDHRTRLDRGEEVEFLYTTQNCTRFRAVVMRHSLGMRLAFHRIPLTIPEFQELNLPPLLAGFSGLSSGLIVVTGFMGSGKSTTLAAMVNHINKNRAQHIVLIENPVEFIYEPGQSLVHQREVGFHVKGFAEGVREACRTGADVVVVSEIRDRETMDEVLAATEKGVLVITTIHSSSVSAGFSELQGLYDPDDRPRFRARLASSLRILMAQTLLNGAHNIGKVPLLEILVNSSALSRVIRSGKFHDLPGVMTKSRGLGSQTADVGLHDLLSRHLISEEEALFHAVDREEVLRRRPVGSGN